MLQAKLYFEGIYHDFACFFADLFVNLKIILGDGVPLITARAGLMTPSDSDVRRVLTIERPVGGFLLRQRAYGPSGYEHSGNECSEIKLGSRK
jgi:hypothetical protein